MFIIIVAVIKDYFPLRNFESMLLYFEDKRFLCRLLDCFCFAFAFIRFSGAVTLCQIQASSGP